MPEKVKLVVKCDCQHDCHFSKPFTVVRHRYQDAVAVTKVKTPISTIDVCQFCADNCLSMYVVAVPK